MIRERKFYKAGFAVVTILLVTLAPVCGHSAGIETRCNNVLLMRAMESLARFNIRNNTRSIGLSTPDECMAACNKNRMLEKLSRVCPFEENSVLPFMDCVKTAKHLDSLLTNLEGTRSGVTSQVLRFNIAYEYLLMYLSFLEKRNVLQFHADTDTTQEIAVHNLVTEEELAQYLLQAQIYLRTLGVYGKRPKAHPLSSAQYSSILKHTGNISYRIQRGKPGIYISVEFLALMIECEKLAGWPLMGKANAAGEPDEDGIKYYDKKTWEWLNVMWKRHCFKKDVLNGAAGTGVSDIGVCPEGETLETMYWTYLSYHFMWRYILGSKNDSLFFSSIERVALNRLHMLGMENGKDTGIYDYYRAEASRDGGNTDFLAPLFFARRGYYIERLIPRDQVPPRELFRLYGGFFKRAASLVQNNIPYRSRIYNELVLFGVGLDDPELMEKRLYPYALDSMRIGGRSSYSGTEMARSSSLTAAYLIAGILDTKIRSGLYEGAGSYREMANMLAPVLIAKDNNNWVYAAIMHKSLADFYSMENAYFNESLAMYHAKQAFLVACQKAYMTYGKNGWRMFFSMPCNNIAVSCLKVFLDFHDKYPANPEAAIPAKFNAQTIVRAWIEKFNNGSIVNKGVISQ